MKELTRADKQELLKLFEEKKKLDKDYTNIMALRKEWDNKLGKITGHKGNLDINDFLLGVLKDEAKTD